MYSETVTRQLKEQFGYKNPMEIPRITKITLNMGVGEAIADRKVMEHAVGDMTKIAGQKPVVIKARKSVAGFKLREGWPVGCKVTLRREMMYEFLDRLINVAIPCVVWILRLQQLQKRMKKGVHCWLPSTFRSGNEVEAWPRTPWLPARTSAHVQ
jgi:ribosomal protein L5